MGSPIMTNLYYGTVKQILERVSSVMIDREAIQHLVQYVKEVNISGHHTQEILWRNNAELPSFSLV